MTLVRDVLARDPSSWSIPNLGVAKVGQPRSDEEWAVLRYELGAFVAEGEYATGLERIMRGYLANLDKPSQPAVWVSGFYGSGKSHLVRVLDSLWTDRVLPDQARASGLVQLPDEIRAHFRELETRSRQFGGRFSAAGVLSAGGTSVALSLLSIVFAAAGLPEDYAQARLVLWLREEGIFDTVADHLAKSGRTLDSVLPHLYVSDHLAAAILAAKPGFAATPADVRQLIKAQFPSVASIDERTFLDVLEETLRAVTPGGDIPLTLVVLDELQQFIGDDTDRAHEVQQIVESCCSRLRSRVLFVGTGQMALGATPTLQKLLDRYTVSVALQDRDLDRVVRSVVLRKRPERAKEVEEVLDRVSGEVSRQLAGSAIAPTGADRDHLVADYPLLPARRRLWERFLRAVDTAGRAGQLRTQLRVVLDATREVAGRELGVVVPGDRIYDEQESALQQSGALPAVTAQLIADLATDSEHGLLGSRVAKAVFIIGKLPKDGPSATGLRATNNTIADLLIEDLRTDGARIRERVPVITKRLAERGILLEVDGAYLLQTPAAAEWAADYQAHVQDLRTDVRWQSDRRAELLREAFGETERTVKPRQGKSLVARKVRVAMGSEEPKVEPGEIPVWVRDGWSATEREVRDDAQRAGTDSPLVLVWIPKEQADELRAAMVEAQAAKATVDLRAVPGHRGRPQRQGRPHLAARRRAGAGAHPRAADRRGRTRVPGRRQRGRRAGRQRRARPVADPGGGQRRPAPLPGLRPGGRQPLGSRDQAREGRVAEPLSPLGHRGEVDEHPVPRRSSRSWARRGSAGRTFAGSSRRPPTAGRRTRSTARCWRLSRRARSRPATTASPRPRASSPRTSWASWSTGPSRSSRPPTTGCGSRVWRWISASPPPGSEIELAPRILVALRALADAAGGDAPLPACPSVEAIRDLEGWPEMPRSWRSPPRRTPSRLTPIAGGPWVNASPPGESSGSSPSASCTTPRPWTAALTLPPSCGPSRRRAACSTIPIPSRLLWLP